jgi:hypothetical protein
LRRNSVLVLARKLFADLVFDELPLLAQPVGLGCLGLALVVVDALLARLLRVAATGGVRLRSWRDGAQFLPFAAHHRTTG